MFVTNEFFEHSMPENSLPWGQRYWHAFTLSLESPWFLFTYVVDYEGVKLSHSTAVAWESTLIELVKSVKPCARQKMLRMGKIDSLWQLQELYELWMPSPEEAERTGILLFGLKGESLLRDVDLKAVPQAKGRTLIYREPDSLPAHGEK